MYPKTIRVSSDERRRAVCVMSGAMKVVKLVRCKFYCEQCRMEELIRK